MTNRISSHDNGVVIEDILLKNGKICTPDPGIFTNIYLQDQQLTKDSNPTFKTITVNNVIITDDSYIPVNPEPKMLTSVSVLLNENNRKFKVPFNCYISSLSSCINKKIILEINFEKINFEKTTDIEHELFENDIIKIIGFDTFLILSFYEKKRERDVDIKQLEADLLDLKNIIYTMTGRL